MDLNSASGVKNLENLTFQIFKNTLKKLLINQSKTPRFKTVESTHLSKMIKVSNQILI